MVKQLIITVPDETGLSVMKLGKSPVDKKTISCEFKGTWTKGETIRTLRKILGNVMMAKEKKVEVKKDGT